MGTGGNEGAESGNNDYSTLHSDRNLGDKAHGKDLGKKCAMPNISHVQH